MNDSITAIDEINIFEFEFTNFVTAMLFTNLMELMCNWLCELFLDYLPLNKKELPVKREFG